MPKDNDKRESTGNAGAAEPVPGQDIAFYPCTPKYLDVNDKTLLMTASDRAINENPANSAQASADSVMVMTGLVLTPEHLVVMTSKYWGPQGVKLTVAFMDQTPIELQKRILSHFNAWSQFCNVTFTLVSMNQDPQVRVTRSGQGYWSYLGTDILSIDRNQPTMCLQGFTMSTPESEFKRVVRHEVGHTLGFPHEHMRSQIISRLDVEKTIRYFQETQGWSRSTVIQQVLTPLAESSVMGTRDADETSIMTYSLPANITKDGRPVLGGKDIEEQDQMAVSKLYPKTDGPVVPPPPVSIGDVKIAIAYAEKTIYGDAPSGWKLAKMPGSALTIVSPSLIAKERYENVEEERQPDGEPSESDEDDSTSSAGVSSGSAGTTAATAAVGSAGKKSPAGKVRPAGKRTGKPSAKGR